MAKRKTQAARHADASGADEPPACVYTRSQLVELRAAMEPYLSLLRYDVPNKCAAVLAGEVKGGVEASPPKKAAVAVE